MLEAFVGDFMAILKVNKYHINNRRKVFFWY